MIFLLVGIVAGAGQSVYKNDGTTVLGNNAKCMVFPCDSNGTGWAYSDQSTGAVTIINSGNYASICGAGPCKIK